MVDLPAGRQARIMYFVYILQSLRTGEFYKGITNNIERRFNQHLAGKSPTTKSKLPLRLIHVEICNNRIEAGKLEKFFKSGFGREIINELLLP